MLSGLQAYDFPCEAARVLDQTAVQICWHSSAEFPQEEWHDKADVRNGALCVCACWQEGITYPDVRNDVLCFCAHQKKGISHLVFETVYCVFAFFSDALCLVVSCSRRSPHFSWLPDAQFG